MAIYHLGDSTNHRLSKPVITIGTFDGVHLGHGMILDEVKNCAHRIGGESVVITFEPHPRQVLDPGHPLQILTPNKSNWNTAAWSSASQVSVKKTGIYS